MSDPTEFSEDSYAPDSADGTLVILVCRAKHLPNRRKLDKQSPYVNLRLGTVAKKTPSHFRAGQTPEWTHEIRFQLTRERKPTLKIDILDETKNDPTPIGNTEIDCSVIFHPENKKVESDRSGKQIEKFIFDKWYDLTLNGRRAGMLYLEMTFYPSAPVLPPKISLPLYPEHEIEAPYQAHSPYQSQSPYQSRSPYQSHTPNHSPNGSIHRNSSPFNASRHSQLSINGPAPPQHPQHSKQNSVADEVFVSADYNVLNRDRVANFFKNGNHSPGSASIGNENEVEDFDDGQPLKGAKKYTSKLNKLTKKFQNKEPITKLWVGQNGSVSPTHGADITGAPGQLSRSISPLSAYEIDNLDQLERDVQSHYYKSPVIDDDYINDEIEFAPPIPPPHLVTDDKRSRSPIQNDDKPPPPPSHIYKKKSPQRIPPPSSDFSTDFQNLDINHSNNTKSNHKNNSTTAIPFSADTIGLGDDDDDYEGGADSPSLPTKVFFLDKAVTSLSHPGYSSDKSPFNPDGYNPKFHAPTPSEHFNKSLRLQQGNAKQTDVSVDYRTQETGYLGGGRWSQNHNKGELNMLNPGNESMSDNNKFSPSIFDRIPITNDENSGFENKPHVPPKVPQGMSEMEYYILEKEKFLKDINGNRL